MTWKSIDTAPRDAVIEVLIPGEPHPRLIFWERHLENGDGYGGWMLDDDGRPPSSWHDGICWHCNEDGEPSVEPTHWRPSV